MRARAAAGRVPATVHLVIPGDAVAVRKALGRLFGGATLGHLPATDRGLAELALAEVLNNVVEHAYRDGAGKIELTLSVGEGDLRVTVVDRGLPLPGGRLPQGTLPEPGPDGPAEGGYGWFLIRQLSCDLAYRRINGRNELRFRLLGDQS
jgi:serine/threonine-protein kinase RsbW